MVSNYATQPALKDSILNPYKEIEFSISDGETFPIFYACTFIRILELSNTADVFMRFGQSGSETNIVGSGIGYEVPEVIDSIYIRNDSGSTITGKVALAIGRIYDDRLNVSGQLVVARPSTFETAADLAVTDVAAIALAADTDRYEVFLTNIDLVNTIYIGDGSLDPAGGFTGTPLKPGQTFIITTKGDVYAATATGLTATLAINFTGA